MAEEVLEEEQDEEECPKCPPAGAPAWMATFADMATLLMAFFVLILSFAEFNVPKFKQISGSLKEAFGVQKDESAMGSGYTKRSDYNVIKAKAEEVFYDPAVATKEIVDDVFETVNDRNKLVKTLAIAKSAIRHNMAKDLPKMSTPTCIIWGKNDIVTPPNVADEFHKLLPDSNLYWIDKCGHAAMMEHPERFNEILLEWLKMRGL